MEPNKIPYQDREIRLFTTRNGGLDQIDGDEIITDIRRIRDSLGLQKYGYVTDMDGTMFCEDIGASLLYLKTLTPEFWKDTSLEQFKETLVTHDVNTLLAVAQAEAPNIGIGKPNDQVYIADSNKTANSIRNIIIPTILALFISIKNTSQENQEPNQDDLAKFAYLMNILDRLIMKLEPICVNSLNGRIVPKTRFLANKNIKQTNKLVDQLLEIEPDSQEAHVNMPAALQQYLNLEGYTIKPEVFHGQISRRATRVTSVKRIARKIVGFEDGVISIVTTNLPEIAVRAATSPLSPFHKTFSTQRTQLDGTDFNDYVHGTRLIKIWGQYLPIPETEGVLQKQKLTRTQLLDRIYLTLLSSGDTRTDALMMAQAIKNGGYAIMVGENPEVTIPMFHNELSPYLSKQQLNEQLLFAEQNSEYKM